MGRNLLDGIANLGKFIIDGIKALFVPDTDFITNNVNDFKKHFGFVDTISASVDQFKNFNDDSSTPYVGIDLSAYHGTVGGMSASMGGQAKILDLRFYAPYKHIGDLMVTAFVYILFLWRVFGRLPEIISGAGVIESTSSKIERYKSGGN